ncbi:Non-functional NADPH-dependent codeinone reductase 2 [Nymphaea thermarum]|nr:Non-functional NADPH-dependent codeinone reductase 2 [Nymphaea thermarum]
MENGRIPEVTLNSGFKMPLYRAVLDAVEAGFRHFDSAAVYGSEKPIGKAIKDALEQGRQQFFVTSKLWAADAYPELEGVLPALRKTLAGVPKGRPRQVHWREQLHMQEARRLLPTAKTPPAVEMQPLWQQAKLRELCKSKGSHITAWSPLGAYGNNLWGTNAVLENAVLKETAQARIKTVAKKETNILNPYISQYSPSVVICRTVSLQVCSRWGIQQDVSLVVKSYRKERMKENLDIFYWQLAGEEIDVIRSLPQTKLGVASAGPYKTLDELWDGEI